MNSSKAFQDDTVPSKYDVECYLVACDYREEKVCGFDIVCPSHGCFGHTKVSAMMSVVVLGASLALLQLGLRGVTDLIML